MLQVGEMKNYAKAHGFTILEFPEKQLWITDYDIDGRRQRVVAMRPDEIDVYVIVAAVDSLPTPSLEKISREELVKIVRISSDALLARLVYIDKDREDEKCGYWAATSEHSVAGATAERVVKRMEATARLANEIAKVFMK